MRKRISSDDNEEGKTFQNKDLKCAAGISHKAFIPQAHQLRVTKEFLETNKRGLLFYHALGSGKTCAAYLAVDSYRKLNGKKTVYILAPASLASSHQHQYCHVCGESPLEFNENFKFYSYNDRQGIIKKLPRDINDAIIIVDEVQEVLNGKENESATLSHVYESVYRAKNSKVILLSGTPCFTPFQCSLLLNLLDPGITSKNKSVFLSDIDRKDYLFEKCRGLISHVPVPNKELYPERLVPDIVETFPMSRFQFERYFEARTSELEQELVTEQAINNALARGQIDKAKRLKAMKYIQTIKLKSRQICNFAYPDGIPDTDDLNASWILNDPDDTHVRNLKEYSPKMAKLIQRCLTLPGKHMVYGWFKSQHGLYLIYTYLRHCGIQPLLFSGDLGNDNARAQIINKFNAEDNIRGEKYKVILVSGAGAMGISLFGVRHFHNFESSINEFISVQAEGRAFRTMSHHQLPSNERNVQVYRYFTGFPKADGNIVEIDPNNKQKHIDEVYNLFNNKGTDVIGVRDEIKTTEEQIYERGIAKKNLTEQILDIMKRASFDCRESYNSAIKNCYEYIDDPMRRNYDDDYDFDNDGFEDEVVEVDNVVEVDDVIDE